MVRRGSAVAHFTETPTRSPRSMASCSRRMNSRNACALPLKSSQLTAPPAAFFKGVGFLAQSRILAGHPCLTKPDKHTNSEKFIDPFPAGSMHGAPMNRHDVLATSDSCLRHENLPLAERACGNRQTPDVIPPY